MKLLIYTIPLAWLLTGCLSGGGPAADSADLPYPSPDPTPIPVSVTVRSGSGFECLLFDSALYCRGDSVNADLAILSVGFEPYVIDSDSSLTGLLIRDDTLCFSSVVSERPLSGDVGTASYCIGEATLQNTNGVSPSVYSGPVFSLTENGSSDLVFSSGVPMFGAEVNLQVLLNSNIFTDGLDSVSERTESCGLNGSTLSCETFTMEVLGE